MGYTCHTYSLEVNGNYKQGILQFEIEIESIRIPVPQICSLRSSRQSHRSRNKLSLDLSPSIILMNHFDLLKDKVCQQRYHLHTTTAFLPDSRSVAAGI